MTNMEEFQNIIKKAISEFSKNIITEVRFVNIVSDYGGFKECSAYKMVLAELVNARFTAKLVRGKYSRKQLEEELPIYTQEAINRFPFRENFIQEVIEAILSAYVVERKVHPILTITKKGTTLTNCKKSAEGHIDVPEGVTTISKEAFVRCSKITSITLPSTLTEIGESCFEDCCDLEEITIPNGVTSIPDKCFQRCKKLSSVTLPHSVCRIGDCAFYGCSTLLTIQSLDNIETIGSHAFGGCSMLNNVKLSNKLTKIGTYAFKGCNSLDELLLPSSVRSAFNIADCPICVDEKNEYYTSIDGCLYYRKITYSLENVPKNKDIIHVKKRITSVGSVFWNTNNHEIYLNEGLENISWGAFTGCKASIISLPKSLKRIENSAFHDTSRLQSLVIPASIKEIGDDILHGSAIKTLTIEAKDPNKIKWGSFTYDWDRTRFYANCTLLVPENSIKKYKTHPVTKDFLTILPLSEKVVEHPNLCIEDISPILGIKIGETTESEAIAMGHKIEKKVSLSFCKKSIIINNVIFNLWGSAEKFNSIEFHRWQRPIILPDKLVNIGFDLDFSFIEYISWLVQHGFVIQKARITAGRGCLDGISAVNGDKTIEFDIRFTNNGKHIDKNKRGTFDVVEIRYNPNKFFTFTS